MFCVTFCAGDMMGPRGESIFGTTERLVEIGFVLDVAADGLKAHRQQLPGIIALDGIDVRVAPRLLLERLAEGRVLRVVEAVAVMQSRLDALGRPAPRVFLRSRKPEPHSGALMPAAAYSLTNWTAPPPAKNDPDHVYPETGQLGEKGLKVGLRKWQCKAWQHLAAAFFECLLKSASASGTTASSQVTHTLFL